MGALNGVDGPHEVVPGLRFVLVAGEIEIGRPKLRPVVLLGRELFDDQLEHLGGADRIVFLLKDGEEQKIELFLGADRGAEELVDFGAGLLEQVAIDVLGIGDGLLQENRGVEGADLGGGLRRVF